LSKLSRATIIVALSFAVNKVLAIARQLIIARQFGLSAELDVFNVANNVPDLLYSLISGGALAMAIIPVLSEVLTKEGRAEAWRVFSRVANIAFLVTAVLSLLVGVFAELLVKSSFGIAPGFTAEQQALVVEIMRLDLIATLIFSMAGLLVAGLQANQHFFLPAVAPIMYNLGQIFGALILAPAEGLVIAGVTLPAYGMGVYGIVYGVLIGSALYLITLIPGLFRYQFKWFPGLSYQNSYVKRILGMLAPRIGSMLCYQLTFIARDNIASYLSEGAPTALTYGWMIQQVPETLIGTAFGTALLPTISELFARKDRAGYHATIEKVERVLIALAIPITVVLSLTLRPFLDMAFGFDSAATEQLLWVTRGFMIGLLGHCLLELGSRLFFSQQNAVIPLIAAVLNLGIYVLAGKLLSARLDVTGVALADSIAFTIQAAFLLIIFSIREKKPVQPEEKTTIRARQLSPELKQTILRTLAGSAAAGGMAWFVLQRSLAYSSLIQGLASFLIGMAMILPFIWKELRVFLHL
jgi:putative peptidoglycan lipid II flippase